MTFDRPPHHRDAPEPAWVLAGKTLVYAATVLLFLWPIATRPALVTALAALGVAVVAARIAWMRGLRLAVGVLAGLGLAGLAFPVGQWILDSRGVWGGLDVHTTLIGADAAFYGMLVGGSAFALRMLAARHRVFTALEAALVVVAVAHRFASHRDRMIHRPRELSDWAWTHGVDPTVVLQVFGVCAAVLAVVLLLRRTRFLKLVVSAIALLLLVGGVWWWVKDVRIEQEVDTGGLALTNQEQKKAQSQENDDGESGGGRGSGSDGDGEGRGGGGDGQGRGGGGGGRPPDKPPVPVAVAIFHDDHEPQNGLLYFRQQVLSRFDGNHVVADNSGRFDQDVITVFPQTDPRAAAPVQNPDFHVRVPTSMFLLADHPQPLALTSSVEIKPLPNPDPRRFVSAYGAASLALTTSYKRLSGRPSVPPDWDEGTRAHYLGHPDDPRYAALAEEILRDVDPRFVGDDLMKALAIKRYLEEKGFYTRKERYRDDEDPTAQFLFGSMRGYCVHFAHAAVNLFRSQGIAARVALGYAVDTRMRGNGSSVLILADRAHAWPEIHIADVGWITFDIYPEESDEPPPQIVDQSLENLLGELARQDKSGGRAAEPLSEAFHIPWAAIGRWLLAGFLGALLLAFGVKLARRLRIYLPARDHRWLYAAALDRFSDVGIARQYGETRERYAERLVPVAPTLAELTRAHLRFALRGTDGARAGDDRARQEFETLYRQVAGEYRANLRPWKRALGWLNPLGWWFTR